MSSLLQLGVDSVFAGDFKVVRPLTEGGMGAVYVVEQISTGKQRALKIMHPQLLHDATMRQRFVQEAKVGARVESDHLCEVVSAGIDAATNTPWMVMELLIGETLEAMVERMGARPKSEVQFVFSQLCHAVGAAHDVGIVHRDLKPENIFLCVPRREGVPYVVKVLDFGIAKLVAESDTRSTQAIGSPLWMSPEQAQTGSVISPATDVWSLGLIAFWMLTGYPFWKGAQEEHPNPMKLMLEVCFEALPSGSQRAAEFGVGNLLPEGFDGWFGKCVVREPSERFANARQARLGLEALLSAPSGSAFGSGSYPAITAGAGAGAQIGGGPTSGPGSGRTLAARAEVSGVTALSGLTSPNDVPDLPDFEAPKSPAPVARKEGARIVSAPTGVGGGIASPAPASRPQTSQQQGLSMRDREVLASINRERKAPTGSATTTAVSTTTRAAYANAPNNELPIGKIAIVVALLVGGGFGAMKMLGGHKADDGSKTDTDATRDNAVVPSASAKPVPPTCPSSMAMIPGGSFQNSSATITVDPFCIDKTEVTAAAYVACVKSGKCKPAHATGNWAATAEQMPTRNQACNAGRADRGDHPINCVEWSQAAAYCEAHGTKLPTDVQWEWAARGARLRTTYPWGNTAPTAGQMCWSGDLKRTSTCPVGKHERGHNPFGVADFEGNVREWTATPSGDSQAVLCGSDWTDTDAEELHLSGYCGTAAKTDESSFVGFRCVKGS